MLEFLEGWMLELGLEPTAASWIARGLLAASMAIIGLAANLIAKRIILRGLTQLAARTKSNMDDFLIQGKALHRAAHLAPAIVVYIMAPMVLVGYDAAITFVTALVQVYTIVILMLVASALLDTGLELYRTLDVSRDIPIKGFVQILKIVIYFAGGVLLVAIAVDKSPLFLFSGLGAMTAILMFIFKDAILGFVAGIQLTANRMVSRGDWIEMPKYGADGDVLDVSLTTVKVQNWDKTITTIPTYALISESFKNWRGMSESGGRRIKRAIYIDMRSVRFCDEDMLERYGKIQFISEYISKKRKELEALNRDAKIDNASLANGRRMTNLGTFRAYVVAYLQHHPMINREMTFLVRQLAPTSNGLPIEIYVFSKDKAWENYEAIQADIFDHFLAVVAEFDLNVFQNPTGADFAALPLGGGRGQDKA